MYDVKTVRLNTAWGYATAESYGRLVGRDPTTGRLWAGYTIVTGGKRRVRVSYSDDNGNNWTEESPSGDPADQQAYPTLAVDTAGQPHLFWTHERGEMQPADLYHSVRVAGSWTTPDIIAVAVKAVGTINNCYADPGGNVHFVASAEYTTSPRYNLIYRRYTAGAGDAVETLYSSDANGVMTCAVASGSGNVHALWSAVNWDTVTYSILYRCCSGGAWGAQESLIADEADDWYNHPVQAAVDPGGGLHVVTRTVSHLEYRYRSALGVWGAWEPVRAVIWKDIFPGLWVRGSAPRVVWDEPAGSPEKWAIFFARGNAGVWSDPVEIVSEAGAHNYFPSAAPEAGLVIWMRYATQRDVMFVQIPEATRRFGYWW